MWTGLTETKRGGGLLTKTASCRTCRLQALCLPMGLTPPEIDQLDRLVGRRRRIPARQHVVRAKDPLQALYAIRSGVFKSYEIASDGSEQINRFYVGGELLGLEALAEGVHGCSAVALDDGEVCVIPFAALESLVREIPALQRQLHRVLGREIAFDHRLMRLLGAMDAERKLAVFLTDLSARLAALGYDPTLLTLRMSRQEIANYLGLTLETVSRTFRKLQQQGLIEVRGRRIEIHDPVQLGARVDRQGTDDDH